MDRRSGGGSVLGMCLEDPWEIAGGEACSDLNVSLPADFQEPVPAASTGALLLLAPSQPPDNQRDAATAALHTPAASLDVGCVFRSSRRLRQLPLGRTCAIARCA